MLEGKQDLPRKVLISYSLDRKLEQRTFLLETNGDMQRKKYPMSIILLFTCCAFYQPYHIFLTRSSPRIDAKVRHIFKNKVVFRFRHGFYNVNNFLVTTLHVSWTWIHEKRLPKRQHQELFSVWYLSAACDNLVHLRGKNQQFQSGR